jgi:toxin YoeB
MVCVQESSDSEKWELWLTRQARKDFNRLAPAGLERKAIEILKILKDNPFQNPPPFEKLVGDLSGAYSRRLNIQHRIVYQIIKENKSVKIIRMWTHYE